MIDTDKLKQKCIVAQLEALFYGYIRDSISHRVNGNEELEDYYMKKADKVAVHLKAAHHDAKKLEPGK